MLSAAGGRDSGHSRGAGVIPPVCDFPGPPSGWKGRSQARDSAGVSAHALKAQAHRNENCSRKNLRRLSGARVFVGSALSRLDGGPASQAW
jgi:hypothetical protein